MRIKVEIPGLSKEMTEKLEKQWVNNLERVARLAEKEVDHIFGDTLMIKVAEETLAEYHAWREKVTVPYVSGNQFTYSFTHTGIGTVYIVKHYLGEEFDLTNYGTW